MQPLRVGLRGFGGMGRNLFRMLYDREDLRVVAISDPASESGLEYLLRYDTQLGRFPDEVSIRDGHLYVLGRQVAFSSEESATEVDWPDDPPDVVVETTQAGLTRAEIERHLEQGVSRVILCAPSAEPPDLTVVMGLNDDRLEPEHRIVSNASSTAHCAGPVLALLDDAFGIERAFLSSVHAYTNRQRLADVPAEDRRSGRAAAENIIPQETNAAEVLVEILPQLAGKLSASALNVPIDNGSLVDLVCWHQRPVSVTAVNEVIRTAAASERWRCLLDYEEDPIVSSDILQSSYTSTLDAGSTMVLAGASGESNVSKTISWFNNGWAYARRVVDLIERLRELDGEVAA